MPLLLLSAMSSTIGLRPLAVTTNNNNEDEMNFKSANMF